MTNSTFNQIQCCCIYSELHFRNSVSTVKDLPAGSKNSRSCFRTKSLREHNTFGCYCNPTLILLSFKFLIQFLILLIFDFLSFLEFLGVDLAKKKSPCPVVD